MTFTSLSNYSMDQPPPTETPTAPSHASDTIVVLGDIVSVITFLLPVIAIVMLLRGFVTTKRFKFYLLILEGLTLISSLFQGSQLRVSDFQTRITIQFLQDFVAEMVFVTICLINIKFLELFAVLIPWVTPRVIRSMQVFFVTAFVLAHIATVLKFLDPFSKRSQNLDQGFQIFSICLFVLYDNTQAAYLQYKILMEKKQEDSKNSALVHQVHKTIRLNLIVIIVDWAGLGLFLYGTTFEEVGKDRMMHELAISILGIHAFLMIFIFNGLKGLQFPDYKAKEKQRKQNKKIVISKTANAS